MHTQPESFGPAGDRGRQPPSDDQDAAARATRDEPAEVSSPRTPYSRAEFKARGSVADKGLVSLRATVRDARAQDARNVRET
jgi:hypothetical protein